MTRASDSELPSLSLPKLFIREEIVQIFNRSYLRVTQPVSLTHHQTEQAHLVSHPPRFPCSPLPAAASKNPTIWHLDLQSMWHVWCTLTRLNSLALVSPGLPVSCRGVPSSSEIILGVSPGCHARVAARCDGNRNSLRSG